MPKKGTKMSDEQKIKIGSANLGKRRTTEQRKQLSFKRKSLFAEGKLQTWNKGKHDIYSLETRQRISDGAKREWLNLSEEQKERLAKIRSATFKRMWSDKSFSEMMHAVLINNTVELWKNPKHKERISAAQKAHWKDRDYVNNMKNKLQVRPNGEECYLDAVLQLNFKRQWMYTGDFEFWIDGKNPDFVHTKEKLLIEYNGNPINHTPGLDMAKTEHYILRGWRVLNLYRKDLKDENLLISMIANFIEDKLMITITA